MNGVVINARFLAQAQSGVQRYAKELLGALDARLNDDRALSARVGPVSALYPAGETIHDPGWVKIKLQSCGKTKGHLWEQVTLPREGQGRLLISLCGSGPILYQNQILVIHDANVFTLPGAFSTPYRIFHKTMRPVLARRVNTIASVSKAAATSLAPFLNVEVQRIAVLPNSAEHIQAIAADPNALDSFGLEHGRYFLTVGNQSPNKNIARLVAAHAALRTWPLVIAGGSVPGVSTAAIARSENVRLLGRVTDGQLKSLYAGAQAFIWPALSEGFGIPPLEAMTVGTPVISSNTSAMPEVLGDAAMYFDPNDSSDMARAIGRFLNMPAPEKAALQAQGRIRASLYRWSETADKLLDLILMAQAAFERPMVNC